MYMAHTRRDTYVTSRNLPTARAGHIRVTSYVPMFKIASRLSSFPFRRINDPESEDACTGGACLGG